MRLLLVAGHDAPAASLERSLAEAGYAVDAAHHPKAADALARAGRHCLVLLDLLAPSFGGQELLAGWNAAGLRAMILAFSTGRPADHVACLDAGADDCLGSPLTLVEVLAKVRALLRRRHGIKTPLLRIEDLAIDTTARTVRRGSRDLRLTRREYALLEFLAYRRGEPTTREHLLQSLWPIPDEVKSNTVDSTVRNLRAKIDEDRESPLLQTRWGAGYVLRG